MTFYKNLNPISKLTLTIALLLFLYGILSRLIPIYFFWESLTLSWFVFLIGLILILVSISTKRKLKKERTVIHKIGIGMICFIVIVQIFTFVFLQNSEALKITKENLIYNEEIIDEIGEIKEFSLIPTGNFNLTSNMDGKSGMVNLRVIVKGERGFKTLSVQSRKDFDSDWRIVRIK